MVVEVGDIMKKMALPQLIARVKNQDEEAFNELYRRYYKLVRYIAFGMTKNNADTDEIVQEVFLQVQKSITNLKDPSLFKAWLSRITYSKTKMLFRKNKDHYMDDQTLDLLQMKEEVRKEYLPHQQNRYQSDLDVLYHCMQKLKEPYREVLMLYYFSELNIKEIMDITKLPEGTVKSRLLYAKKYLRIEIENYEKNSGETITFQGRTLEAALLALGSSLVNETSISSISSFHFPIPASALLLWSELALVAVVGIGAFCGFRQLWNQPISSGNTKEVEATAVAATKPFPTLQYRNHTITTARQAYKVLIDFADCEVEMRDKTKAEIEEIRPVYTTLMNFGEGYAELLTYRKWNVMFEQVYN